MIFWVFFRGIFWPKTASEVQSLIFFEKKQSDAFYQRNLPVQVMLTGAGGYRSDASCLFRDQLNYGGDDRG